MVKQASPASGLREIVGAEHVTDGSDAYAVDGMAPEYVVRPGTYEEVCATMRFAGEQKLAVIPVGGPTNAALGNIPSRYDVALDTARLNPVVEFEPADLTITCQAGMTLEALRKAAGEAGLMVPFDPSLPDEGTVGGVLAANVSGPARMSLATPRDFTIGLRVVTADGKLTRAGGKVVKNVAGYDLCKLYIGSLGTLCVIVEATFKTIPLPKAEAHLAYAFKSPEEAYKVASEALRRGLSLRSAVIVRTDSGYRLEIGLAGAPAAVERSKTEIGVLAGDTATTDEVAPSEHPIRIRVSVRPSDVAALLNEAATTLPNASLEAYPTVGVCRIGADAADAIEAAEALADWFGGTSVVERCPVEVKRNIDVFGETPQAFELMRRLKQEFDPGSVLSPGRFVGRL